jgi:PmbA protein
MSDIATDALDLTRLSALAEAALEAARRAGADAADVVAAGAVSLSASVRNGALEESESAEGTDIGLRAFVGARSALVSINAGGDLRAAAERAVAMARAAPEDPTVAIAPANLLARDTEAAPLDLFDRAAPTLADLTERAMALEAAMLAVPGVTNSGGVGASAARSARVLATTNGFLAGYLTSSHSHGATAIAGEGTRMERDSWGSSRRHLADLEAIESVGRTAGERAVKRLGGEPITTRRAPVVFEPRIAAGFVGHVLAGANGAAVARGSTILKDRRGERILPAGIGVHDDPRKPRGQASRPFDAEGIDAQPLDIVADGVLEAFILDLSSARKLGLASNARAARGTGTPSPSATNVTVSGGAGDLRSLMREAGSGLLVTSLFGVGVNLVNGTYSRGAAGFWFEADEIVHPVNEITIGGTLLDMFARARFGDDAPGLYATDAPSVLLDGMTIGGR